MSDESIIRTSNGFDCVICHKSFSQTKFWPIESQIDSHVKTLKHQARANFQRGDILSPYAAACIDQLAYPSPIRKPYK